MSKRTVKRIITMDGTVKGKVSQEGHTVDFEICADVEELAAMGIDIEKEVMAAINADLDAAEQYKKNG